MRLFIAGINHYDPSCRAALEQWFRHLAASLPAPLFVATEWNESAFQIVRGQRPQFRRMLAAQWPTAPGHVLDLLERSLGYEGDAHIVAFPNAEVLWLGTIAPTDAPRLETYASDRLNMYKGFLAGSPLSANPDSAAHTLGAEARKVVVHDRDTQRDRDFATKIMDRAGGHPGAWATVVVGADHAADDEWSMRCVLQDHGYSCQVSFL